MPLWGNRPNSIRSRRNAGRWLETGACAFPICPQVSAEVNPATWLAEVAPAVIVLAPAPPGLIGIVAESILLGRSIVSDISDRGDRHLVLTDSTAIHRLMVVSPDHRAGHHVAIVPDDCWGIRRAALDQFVGGNSGDGIGRLQPTSAQHHRLILMLRILDYLNATEPPEPTLRSIAETVLFPRRDLGRAIEWKCSSERRQTQRLVSSARQLMQGGYRQLLKGKFERSSGKCAANAVS